MGAGSMNYELPQAYLWQFVSREDVEESEEKDS